MATQRTKQRPRLRPGGAKSAGPARRALLVAINDYGNPQNDLPSCLEDATQFRSVLQDRYGFDDIAELYDADATVDSVDEGLMWLFDGVDEDDRLVFFYSGHGYQQPRNGNLEECLVLSGREHHGARPGYESTSREVSGCSVPPEHRDVRLFSNGISAGPVGVESNRSRRRLFADSTAS